MLTISLFTEKWSPTFIHLLNCYINISFRVLNTLHRIHKFFWRLVFFQNHRVHCLFQVLWRNLSISKAIFNHYVVRFVNCRFATIKWHVQLLLYLILLDCNAREMLKVWVTLVRATEASRLIRFKKRPCTCCLRYRSLRNLFKFNIRQTYFTL